MKSRKLLFWAFAAVAMLAGCQEKPEDLGDPRIDLDQSTVQFSKESSEQAISFVATRAWSIKDLPGWLAAEPEKGEASANKQTVVLKALANTGNDRSAVVTVSCGIVKEYVTVNQAGEAGAPVKNDGSKEHPYLASEANAVALALADGQESSQAYYVKGFVKKFGSKHEAGIKDFGNALFYITDDASGEGNDFYCYQVYYLGGQRFTSLDQINVGDEVIVYGKITNYGGTAETVGKGAAYIYSLNGVTEGGDEPGPGPGPVDPISGTNLLDNGSFEDWTADKPQGWDFTNGNASLKKVSDAKEGATACEIEGVADSNKRLMSKEYTLAPGTYQIQAYVKGEGQYRVGYAKLTNHVIADTQNDYVYIDSDPVQATSDWTLHTVQFTLSAQTGISVNFMNNKKGNGKSVIVDDVKLITNDGALIEGEDTPVNVVDATVSQVLSEKKTDVRYRLSGTVSNFNSQYCSFDLTDATGTIYVYSVTSDTKSKYSGKLKDGDTVTIEGTYQFYAQKEQDEIVNADITSWTTEGGQGGGDDEIDPSTLSSLTCAQFNALAEEDAGWYILEGKVVSIANSQYGNLYIQDESGEMAYIYGVNGLGGEEFGTLGIEKNDVIKVYGQHTIYIDTYNNNAKVVELKSGKLLSLTKGEDTIENSIVTLTFPDDNSAENKVNGYDDPWVARSGNYTFKMIEFNNYEWNGWKFIRCGRKKESIASIASEKAISEVVSKLVISFDSYDANLVNSVSLVVARDAAFSDVVETISVKASMGDVETAVSSPAAGLYYKIVFDCKKGSKNGFIQISSFSFLK